MVVRGNAASYSVNGFPNEFKQVLLIIFNNAREAIVERRQNETEAFTGIITVSLEKNDKEVRIAIQDNGCGIKPTMQARLFEPYVTSKGEQGTGIGLYMSKTIIEENMEGHIKASALESGTEFLITLPKITD